MSSVDASQSAIIDVFMSSSGDKMKSLAGNVVLFCCASLLVSCSGSGSGLLGSGQADSQAQTPVVAGEWEVDYEFNGKPFQGTATFSQSGAALAGSGVDQDGKEWQVDAGQIQGTRVSFGKKYVNSSSPPIIYHGELKYLQSPEYTGWAMEGTYCASSPDGSTVSGKWVSNPLSRAATPNQ
jgi:hypothetical protein